MKALVVGMGKTGLSIARHLAGLGYVLTAADTRAAPPLQSEFAKLANVEQTFVNEDIYSWPAQKFASFARVAASPGVSPRSLAVAMSKVTGDAALFAESWAENPPPIKLFAFTGTNGKSTAVSLSAQVCRAAGWSSDAIGNIGKPLLDALAEWRAAEHRKSKQRDAECPQTAAAELSSFQLETADSFPSECAAVLNVSADHLDRHAGITEYAKIKSRIYNGAKYRAVNLDDKFVAAMVKDPDIAFSQMQDADYQLQHNEVVRKQDGARLSCRPCAAPGQNILAALATLAPLNLPAQVCQTGLDGFRGLPHRRQLVGCINGVSYINDSKATNLESARFALQNADSDVVLIAGGDGKGQDFSPLADACQKVKKAFLFGKDANALLRALQTGGVESEIVADMKTAAAAAAKIARPGEQVLLSPACSSLDMYADYAQRGDDFAAAYRELQRESQTAGESHAQ